MQRSDLAAALPWPRHSGQAGQAGAAEEDAGKKPRPQECGDELHGASVEFDPKFDFG